jgi:hypothetical protein
MRHTFGSFATENWIVLRPHAVLAITWLAEDEFHFGPVAPYDEPAIPATVAPAWQRVGHDVSDGSLRADS